MKQLDRSAVDELRERLGRIGPDSRPSFGRMRPEELMPHCRMLIELSLEEISHPDVNAPLSKTFLFRWAVLALPWPKGKVKAPEGFLPAPEGEMDAEREKLIAAAGRFAEALERDPGRKTRSPLLGPLTLRDWGRLHAKHFEHHLRQFGA